MKVSTNTTDFWACTQAGRSVVHAIAGQSHDAQLWVNGQRAAWDLHLRKSGRYLAVLSVPVGVEVSVRDKDAPRRPPVGAIVPRLDTRPNLPARDGLIIALSVHNPNPVLFRRQIASLQAQTVTQWRCVVLDAGTSDQSLVHACIPSDDARFTVVRSSQAYGAPQDYMRLLEALPPCDAVALCDGDDVWRPDKLERLMPALSGQVRLAYSDMRVVDSDGAVLSGTFWVGRRNQWSDLLSLALANTITSAASVIDPSILALASPFPVTFGKTFHDQWLGLCALCLGDIAYVDAPLYDYVQHGAQDIGHRLPRGSALVRDLFNGSRVLDALGRRWMWVPQRTDLALMFERDLLRLKHLALTLTGRLEGMGRAPPEPLGLIAAGPASGRFRSVLAARGLKRFGRVSETVGNDLRLLAAASIVRAAR